MEDECGDALLGRLASSGDGTVVNSGGHPKLTQLCVPYMEEQKWGRVIYTSR